MKCTNSEDKPTAFDMGRGYQEPRVGRRAEDQGAAWGGCAGQGRYSKEGKSGHAGRTPPYEGGGRRSCLLAQSPALGAGAPFVIGSGKVRRSKGDNQWWLPRKGVCWEGFLLRAGLVVFTSGCLRMSRRGSKVSGQNADCFDPWSSTSSGTPTTVENARAAAKRQPRIYHLQTLNPTPEGQAASPWRRAAKCGCARVTERGRRGGGVLVPAARRPFRLVRLKASRSFFP
ncbi:uncharacterized protein LOC128778593 [Panthera pardus]|uniref:Uncharacterized protein LOC128778593 n=1 Tax=Panthera pardus TaxID=9691 RepID=A0A9W2VZF5_PANPR|nr:uncharacterized protein LOC128778593 [Panthera pardus]